MALFGCEEVCRWPLFWAGDARGASRGFLLDRPGFLFDRFTVFEESVVASPGLEIRGGDDGGVVTRAAFCAEGVMFLL